VVVEIGFMWVVEPWRREARDRPPGGADHRGGGQPVRWILALAPPCGCCGCQALHALTLPRPIWPASRSSNVSARKAVTARRVRYRRPAVDRTGDAGYRGPLYDVWGVVLSGERRSWPPSDWRRSRSRGALADRIWRAGQEGHRCWAMAPQPPDAGGP
jgi:hypothetical protein